MREIKVVTVESEDKTRWFAETDCLTGIIAYGHTKEDAERRLLSVVRIVAVAAKNEQPATEVIQ